MDEKKERQRYRCTSCGYKFKRNSQTFTKKICPYCGKDTIEKHVFSEAAELLDEIARVPNRYDN